LERWNGPIEQYNEFLITTNIELPVGYNERELNQIFELFKSLIGNDIENSLKIEDKYKFKYSKIVDLNIYKHFIDKLFLLSCPRILNYVLQLQQTYLLHLCSVLFYKYNNEVLKLDDEKFIEEIYMPNILVLCSKYFPVSRKLLHTIIKNVYDEIECNNADVIKFYIHAYNVNSNLLKTDIVYIFLREIIHLFDPLEIVEVVDFYSSIFKKIFFFYLKTRTTGLIPENINLNLMKDSEDKLNERLRIYVEAIGLAQIQLACQYSSTLTRIKKQYKMFEDNILSNELQKLFILSSNDSSSYYNNEKIFLHVQTKLDDMTEVKKETPLVYELLQSIRIKTELMTMPRADEELLRQTIYETLFKNLNKQFDATLLKPIIEKITNNLTQSLVIGSYINLATLQPVQTSSMKFFNQLKMFLEMLLKPSGEK
jgi:hypothetical protein